MVRCCGGAKAMAELLPPVPQNEAYSGTISPLFPNFSARLNVIKQLSAAFYSTQLS